MDWSKLSDADIQDLLGGMGGSSTPAPAVAPTLEEPSIDQTEHAVESKVEETAAPVVEPDVKASAARPDITTFLKDKHKFELKDNQAMFSDVFFKPTLYPDFPVPQYAEEYWHEDIRDRIPEVDPKYYLNVEAIQSIMYGLYTKGTLLVYGPTGTGKTSVLEQIAARCKVPFFRVSCHGHMEQTELVGSNKIVVENGSPITVHSDTEVTLAAKYGGMLCLDEVFRAPPASLMTLQPTLEYPHKLTLQDSHQVEKRIDIPNDDFFLAVTDNTNGTGDANGLYVAEVQDASTLNRIRSVVFLDYADPKSEEAMLADQYEGLPSMLITQMVSCANLVRQAFMNGMISNTMSIRELLSWSEGVTHLRNVPQSFQAAVYNRCSVEDRVVVSDIFNQVFGYAVADAVKADKE